MRRAKSQTETLLPVVSDEFHVVAGVTGFYTIDTYRVAIRRVARLTAIEVVHREGGVRRDFVQTLPVPDSLLHRVLIVEYFIAWKKKEQRR